MRPARARKCAGDRFIESTPFPSKRVYAGKAWGLRGRCSAEGFPPFVACNPRHRNVLRNLIRLPSEHPSLGVGWCSARLIRGGAVCSKMQQDTPCSMKHGRTLYSVRAARNNIINPVESPSPSLSGVACQAKHSSLTDTFCSSTRCRSTSLAILRYGLIHVHRHRPATGGYSVVSWILPANALGRMVLPRSTTGPTLNFSKKRPCNCSVAERITRTNGAVRLETERHPVVHMASASSTILKDAASTLSEACPLVNSRMRATG